MYNLKNHCFKLTVLGHVVAMKTRPPFYHFTLSMLAWVVIILYIHTSASQPLTANQIDSDSEEVEQWPVKEKRPFCNAFAGIGLTTNYISTPIFICDSLTGCGRKRAMVSMKEARSPSYEKAVDSHPRPLNTETSKLLDRLFARLHHFRTSSSGQLDEVDYK